LEWVVDKHLNRAEDNLDQLQANFEGVMLQSKKVHFRKYDQQLIAHLKDALDQAHKRLSRAALTV
jgi:hypothetical protein